MPKFAVKNLPSSVQDIESTPRSALYDWADSASFKSGKVYVIDQDGLSIYLDIPRPVVENDDDWSGNTYTRQCVHIEVDGAMSPEQAAGKFNEMFAVRDTHLPDLFVVTPPGNDVQVSVKVPVDHCLQTKNWEEVEP